MTDDEIVEAMAVELTWKAHTPMEFVCQPATVFQLTALVQLACRHPAVSGPMRDTSDRFLANVRAYFADCPAVLEVIRRGDDPSEDS